LPLLAHHGPPHQIHSEPITYQQLRIHFDKPDGTPGSLTLSLDHYMMRLTCGGACKAAAPSVEQRECVDLHQRIETAL
jgi:hypothetical protein